MGDIFDDALKTVDELRKSINPSIQKAFDDNKDVINDIQANVQMFDRGEKSDGGKIVPKYSLITKIKKTKKGQPTDRVTLRDTGKFHRTLEVIARDDEVEITTSVDYAKYLFKKYGDDILGIQEEMLEEFVEQYILTEIKKTFDDKIAES